MTKSKAAFLLEEEPSSKDDDAETKEAKASADPRYVGIWVRSGSQFDIYAPAVGTKLEPATYVVQAAPMRGFYLELLADLPVPTRIYGINHAERIMRSYRSRAEQGTSTGVWLNGEKGSGKTMLASVLSKMGRELGLPTVLVQTPYTGPGFNALIEHLGQAVVVFDEFEKVYSEDGHKDGLLTMFAGSVVAKHLYVVTTNSDWKVSEAMRNRPGRMRYFIDYKGVSEDVVQDYLNERLKDKSVMKELVKALAAVPECNFDILMAAVEEHNMFGGSVADLLAIMNINRRARTIYKITYVGKDGDGEHIEGTGEWTGELDDLLHGSESTDEGHVMFGVRYRNAAGKSCHTHVMFEAPDVPEFDELGGIVLRNTSGVAVLRQRYSGFSKYRQQF
jgi:hypothetical protein